MSVASSIRPRYAAAIGATHHRRQHRPKHPVECPAPSQADWLTHYRTSGFLDIGRTIRAGRRNTNLIVWPHTMYDEASLLWADAQDFGIKLSVTQSNCTAHD